MTNALLTEEQLLSSGLLTGEQIAAAREEAAKTGFILEKAIIRLGLATEEDIAGIIAQNMGVPFVDIRNYIIDPEFVMLVPEALAKKHALIPLFKIRDALTVAMANPQDIIAIDDVRAKSRCAIIEPVLATRSAIEQAIDQYYGAKGKFEDVIRQIDTTRFSKMPEDLEASALQTMAQEPPIVKLVNMMIAQAIREKASDIHIEPEEDKLRVRYRVDGILHETSSPPKRLANAIISRIKVLAHMDISEKRKPQDGRIQLKIENKDIDLRVSTFPTIHGENVVLRILDKSSVLLGLNELGFEREDLLNIQKLVNRPYGIILVTGPTGSGKTTTLYAALSTINSTDKNIITIEDPVEYQLPLIRQTQVNPKAGLTFATGLRSILRQDPNVIMVGEVRDKETADIAVQAALTGHLVFSTLHTNDAAGALARLTDMGIEPFLIASSVIGVVAQRLIRVLCPKCREAYAAPADVLKVAGIAEISGIKLYRQKGCRECKEMGYKGRTALFEVLVISERIRELITEKASSSAVRQEAIKNGMGTLRDNGLAKVQKGVTTLEEVLRATQEE
ncbi:MAG: type II secretion system ATPase GspE [Candidatus Omnitrophica bacterium]|nr:type II secretion system ATPase GspE [Candidatus Omnitrophota bacterium]